MLKISERRFTPNAEHADHLRYNPMTSAFSLPSDRHRPYSVIDITEMRSEAFRDLLPNALMRSGVVVIVEVFLNDAIQLKTI
jgi:hypothetical protein